MENKSGLMPVEVKVLVLPDEVDEKTSGGLYLPDTVRDKERMAQVKATLVAVGGNAFEDWEEPIPIPGDRVYVAKYAGIRVPGADNKEYQLINDNDIAAIVVGE